MQISIKYVNFPRPGTKYGSIVGQDGFKVMVPPDLLDQFRSGQIVDINTKQQTWYRDTPQEAVVTIATGGPTGPVQGQGGQTGYQRPAGNQGGYRPNTGFQPRVIQGGPTQQSDDEKSRNIFVCGVVQQAMSSGKFTASEIRVLTQEANAAFDLIHPLPRTQTQPPPDRGYFNPTAEPPPLGEPDDPGPELQ